MTTVLIMRLVLFCSGNPACIEQMEDCVRFVQTGRWVMHQSDDIEERGRIALTICERDYVR